MTTRWLNWGLRTCQATIGCFGTAAATRAVGSNELPSMFNVFATTRADASRGGRVASIQMLSWNAVRVVGTSFQSSDLTTGAEPAGTGLAAESCGVTGIGMDAAAVVPTIREELTGV